MSLLAAGQVPYHSITYQPGGDQKPSLNSIAEALGKDGPNIFPFTATLDKKILHDLLYIFLRETLTPLSTHI